MNLGERDAFCRGFSLAVRLLTEAMSNKLDKKNSSLYRVNKRLTVLPEGTKQSPHNQFVAV